jgi:signal transduction histidine kinase
VNAVPTPAGEDDLRDELEELRARVARRAAFVAVLAHDVRTPLAAIIGSAQTLQLRGHDLTPEQSEQLLAVIGREAERLASLLGEALDTARIDTDTFSYVFADVDLAELVDEAVAAANATGGDVVGKVQAGLPHVNADGGRLRQLLSNLIDNAVKFSPPGGTVEVVGSALDRSVRVAVTDHGEGIAAENHELIFQQFGRVAGTGKPGSGLGLFICRAIAEAHGGTLEVASTPGEGATFTLSLPVG